MTKTPVPDQADWCASNNSVKIAGLDRVTTDHYRI
mgnify:CR=1 FL=1|jgi:hypothetical protein